MCKKVIHSLDASKSLISLSSFIRARSVLLLLAMLTMAVAQAKTQETMARKNDTTAILSPNFVISCEYTAAAVKQQTANISSRKRKRVHTISHPEEYLSSEFCPFVCDIVSDILALSPPLVRRVGREG